MTSSSQAQDANWGWLRVLWDRDWLKGLLLVAAVVFAYQPAWHGGFIWDDDTHISANETLHSLRGLWDIWFKPGVTCQYYPLSFTVFWAGYHLWGLNPLGYHLQNILLQGLVAVLLWQVLKRLEVRAAWLAGAIFALHPVNVMSVAWMTELKNTLAGALGLGAVWAYLRFAGLGVYEPVPPERTAWRYGLLSLAFFQLAMFAKTAVSFFPVTLLLLVWWKRGRITWRWVWPLPVMFGIAAGMGLVTLHVEHIHGATGDEFRMGLLERVLVSGRSFWFYLGKLFFPYPLTFIYERWKIDTGVWWQYLYPVATLGLLGGLWLMRGRVGKGLSVAMLHFYVATSLLVLIQVLYMMLFTFVSDHWQYFGCMSVIAVAAAGMDTAFDFVKQGRLLLKRACYGILLLTLGVLTWRQCGMYADIETLWRTTIARNPNCFLARNNLGNIFFRDGRMDEAIEQYQKALGIWPRYVLARNNLGNVFLRNGRVDEAIEQYQKALALQPGDANTHDNLGNALLKKGQVDEAIIHFRQALALQPDDGATHDYLGNGLLKKGQVDEAMAHFQKALAIQPDNAEFHNNFGNALLGKGKPDEAIEQYQKALALRPVSAEFHNNLGTVLLRNGRVDEAIVHFQKAAEIQPDYIKAHEGLGMAFFQKAQVDEAIVHFQEVLRIHPDFAEANNNLGAAFLQKGQMNEAIAYYQKAVQLEPRNAEFQSNLGYALFLRGEVREAVAHYQTSLEIQPQNAITCKNLAWILATCPEASVRNGAKAVQLAEQAARLSGSPDPIFIGTLAAAYAEAGRFPEAVATAQRAQQLAVDQSNPGLASALQIQIGFYQSGSPFRDTSQTNTPGRSQ
jgi:tetratricopeptide (TPR) repeat protein